MIIRIYIGILLLYSVGCQVRPRNFSPDALPETSFTCEDKVSGSYYTDVEADCQLFHVCVQVSEFEFQDFHFLCPNDTVFDQQHLVCTNWFDVDCQQSIQFFPQDFAFDHLNYEDLDDLGDLGDLDYPEEQTQRDPDKDDHNRFLGFSQPSLSSGLLNDGRGLKLGGPVDDQELGSDQDEHVRVRGPRPVGRLRTGFVNPPITTTPIPAGFTTTKRSFKSEPRVKSNLHQQKQNNPGSRGKTENRFGSRVQTKSGIRGPVEKTSGFKALMENSLDTIVQTEKEENFVDQTDFRDQQVNTPSARAQSDKKSQGSIIQAEIKQEFRGHKEINQGSSSQAENSQGSRAPTENSQGSFDSLEKSEAFQDNADVSVTGLKNVDESTDGVANLFDKIQLINADGKEPRVKSNINNRLIQIGKIANKPRKQGSKKVELDRTQLNKIEFVEPTVDEETTEVPFLGPNVIPDGRAPRVKSNVLAKSRDKNNDGDDELLLFPTPNPLLFRPTSGFPSRFNVSQSNDQNIPSQPSPINPATIVPKPIFNIPTLPPVTTETSIFSSHSTPKSSRFKLPSFNLGPAPQPKIPVELLSRLPPPTNRFPVTPPTPSTDTSTPLLRTTVSSFALGLGDPEDLSFNPQTPKNGQFLFNTRQQTSNSPTVLSQANQVDFPPPSTPDSFDIPLNIISGEEFSNVDFNDGTIVIKNRERFGSRPRVKANELAKLNNQRNRFSEENRSQSIGQPIRNRVQLARPLPLHTQFDLSEPTTILPNLRFVSPTDEPLFPGRECLNPFKCPPKNFAGGRKPRVKSNIKAQIQNYWNPRESQVIKRRKQKQVRINPILFDNIISQRQGRKQNLRNNSREIINSVDENLEDANMKKEEVDQNLKTTADPRNLLKQLVEDKEKLALFSALPVRVKNFQNSKISSRVKNTNMRKKKISAIKSESAGDNSIESSTTSLATLPTEEFVEKTTPASIFVTFQATPQARKEIATKDTSTTATTTKTTKSTTKKAVKATSPKSTTPKTTAATTQAVVVSSLEEITSTVITVTLGPPTPATATAFTVQDDTGLFVTNPRALIPPLMETNHIINQFSEQEKQKQGGLTPSDSQRQDDRQEQNQLQDNRQQEGHKQDGRQQEGPKQDGRQPRVKSNIAASVQKKSHVADTTASQEDSTGVDEDSTKPVLKIIPDGRAPRVKSNIRSGRKFGNKFDTDDKETPSFFDRPNHGVAGRSEMGRQGAGRSINLDEEKIGHNENELKDYDYMEPEVHPDGRVPRIKSNIRAKSSFSGQNLSRDENKEDTRKETVDEKENRFRSRNDGITTFRPQFILEELLGTPPSMDISVPLPNINLSKKDASTISRAHQSGPAKENGKKSAERTNSDTREKNEALGRFSFRPTPRSTASRKESADDQGTIVKSKGNTSGRDSVTEIVKVFLSDSRLFDREHELDYYDYYDDRKKI